ncbi:MAG: outer membrane beta-barrel protein [Bacteroidota bacterium]
MNGIIKSMIFFALLAWSPMAIAQFSFGVEGGFTRAWEDYGDVDLPEDAEIHIDGFNISALAYYRIHRYISLGVEPGFVRRGAACIPGWEPIFTGDTKLLLNYVEMPLMCSANIPLFKSPFEIIARTGYGFSYLASAEEQFTNFADGSVISDEVPLGENSRLNRWDHGWYNTFGVAYAFGPHQVFLNTDFFLGFKDADRFNTSQNRNVNLNVGYMIRL